MTEPDFLRTTRAFYDAVAEDYDDHFRDVLETRPMDRAMLAGFAELVRAAGAGPVVDVGCGPGRVTAHLAALGLSVSGVDLSPRMVALARRAHPGVRFEEGAMTSLDLPDGALGGVVAWYSIIHTPQERLPEVFAEFHRVLAPGGHLLLAFQTGDEPLHIDRPFGHPVSLDFRRRQPDRIADLVGRAGLSVRARLLREPEAELGDTAPQACLMIRKPAAVGA
ncbi:methyltransferase domain-containing protein [Streptomyces caniferus]|uniref:class I SAM-dependent DNA methyltransferase n=1 Tax=Streptomyces caniferus TaxID=285557 RepID=UPI002E2DFB6F|nr:class I SAM-dependent methyltransferase [Streptomyces caniferus]